MNRDHSFVFEIVSKYWILDSDRSHHFMSNRWGNNGNIERFFCGGGDSKITADGDCSHEIKRRLLLGRKAMTTLDCILKSRDITLPIKVCLDKAMVFPVVMYGCETWTIKKVECQSIDAFELWCWRRLLEKSPLDCKEIKSVNPEENHSWIFIGKTDAEAETLILWPPDGNNWLIGKDPDAGQDWKREEKGMTEEQMVGWHHRLETWVWGSSGSWWWTGKPGVLQSIGLQRVRHDWGTELSWTTEKSINLLLSEIKRYK